MIPHTRKYHVITVHHGDDAPTKTLVEQLLQISDGPERIILIDHNQKAFDHTLSSPRLEIVRPSRNSGYAGGVNFGLGLLAARRADPNDIVSIMNNDVTFTPNTFQVLRRWWQAHPSLAVVGAERRALNMFTGRAHPLSTSAHSFWHLPYLDGAFLAAPLQVLTHLQGLPNHLFLYWEDVLFSLRAKQVGLPLNVIPSLGITHHSVKSAASSNDQLYYLVRNGAFILSRSIPYPWRLLWKFWSPIRRIYHALKPSTETNITIRQALRDAAHGELNKRTQ